ncbi:MAG: hypothetical protein ACRDSI_12465 [Pseudonocardiaceae bacterium]
MPSAHVERAHRLAMTTMLLDRPALPVDDATRREFLIGGLSLAALLAGCTGPETQAPAGSGDDRFPITVAHKYGSTAIPAEPARVVTVGLSDHDYLLALGVVPAGLTDWYGDYPTGTWAVGGRRTRCSPTGSHAPQRGPDQLREGRRAAA